MKKPEVLSVAQSAVLNQTVVEKWFDVYEEILTELGIKDHICGTVMKQVCRTTLCPQELWQK